MLIFGIGSRSGWEVIKDMVQHFHPKYDFVQLAWVEEENRENGRMKRC